MLKSKQRGDYGGSFGNRDCAGPIKIGATKGTFGHIDIPILGPVLIRLAPNETNEHRGTMIIKIGMIAAGSVI